MGGCPLFDPRHENHILAILAKKSFEIPKFFLPQISLLIGPIDGIINIFSLEQPYWLYNNFYLRAGILLILDPNTKMAAVPVWLGPGPKFLWHRDHKVR